METVKNYYPDKPVVPYKKTSVEMGEVVAHLKSLIIDKELKRAAYIMFRNESANGQSGINNNYIGAQADSGKWPDIFDNSIIGVVQRNENRTGKIRLFVAFASYKDSISFLINRVASRGLYVGGNTSKITKGAVKTKEDLAKAYYCEWVTGNAKYLPTTDEKKSFLSMYGQAEKIFI